MVNGLSGGNSGLYIGERSEHLNSEEFRETFLRNDREGPTKAKMAERMAETNAGREERPETGSEEETSRDYSTGSGGTVGEVKQQKRRG